jgi:hypothetical protein
VQGVAGCPVEGLLDLADIDNSRHRSSHFSAGWKLPSRLPLRRHNSNERIVRRPRQPTTVRDKLVVKFEGMRRRLGGVLLIPLTALTQNIAK